MGRGNCGLPTAAWDPIHGDQIPGWVLWTDMAQLRPDRERLPSLSERGQGWLPSEAVCYPPSRPFFSASYSILGAPDRVTSVTTDPRTDSQS